ncbi:MAG: class I SAM-dependent methyltransferase [Gemmatimonadales bacterium]|nr:class I SAM-dependent methyltransferase [Gemmatimonadales bacterium]
MDEYAEIAELYDHVSVYRTRPDVGFFVEEARAAGSPVLEIGSGTGRVLIPTARAGVEITGLDASSSMLATCRRELEKEPVEVRARVTLVEGDMRHFELDRRFTLATLPFRPFQHLITVADQLACLATIRRHLVPGGQVILDLFNPSLEALTRPIGVESSPDAEFTMPDGRAVVRRFRRVGQDRATQVNQEELIYDITHPDGRTERLIHAFLMRWFYRFEVEHLLARAGFEVEQIYSDYDRSPFGAKYPGEILAVARVNA